jgi:hypothetical protein
MTSTANETAPKFTGETESLWSLQRDGKHVWTFRGELRGAMRLAISAGMVDCVIVDTATGAVGIERKAFSFGDFR